MAGITPAELAVIGGRLEAFAAEVFESLPRKDQRARGQCYLRGLMLDGRRKSIEPMAGRLGGEVHYQALHHFVAVSPFTPKSGGVGLTLWQLLERLQVVVACWAGACPVCQRPAPRWLFRRGRPRTPT